MKTVERSLFRVELTPYEALWLAQHRSRISMRTLAKKCDCSVNLIVNSLKHKQRNKITNVIFSYFKVDRYEPTWMNLNFGEYVMLRLRQAGVTIGEFSKACGITRTRINAYATQGREPTFKYRSKIIGTLTEMKGSK